MLSMCIRPAGRAHLALTGFRSVVRIVPAQMTESKMASSDRAQMGVVAPDRSGLRCRSGRGESSLQRLSPFGANTNCLDLEICLNLLPYIQINELIQIHVLKLLLCLCHLILTVMLTFYPYSILFGRSKMLHLQNQLLR